MNPIDPNDKWEWDESQHVILSTQTGLQVRWKGYPPCVCCGDPLSYNDVLSALDAGLAPCCTACVQDMIDEMFKYVPMWPNEFYGHWSKGSANHEWTLDKE